MKCREAERQRGRNVERQRGYNMKVELYERSI
jgi:hypothetical protein